MVDILLLIVGILFGAAIYAGIGYGFAVFLEEGGKEQSGTQYLIVILMWPPLVTFLCVGILTHDILKFFARRNLPKK